MIWGGLDVNITANADTHPTLLTANGILVALTFTNQTVYLSALSHCCHFSDEGRTKVKVKRKVTVKGRGLVPHNVEQLKMRRLRRNDDEMKKAASKNVLAMNTARYTTSTLKLPHIQCKVNVALLRWWCSTGLMETTRTCLSYAKR